MDMEAHRKNNVTPTWSQTAAPDNTPPPDSTSPLEKTLGTDKPQQACHLTIITLDIKAFLTRISSTSNSLLSLHLQNSS